MDEPRLRKYSRCRARDARRRRCFLEIGCGLYCEDHWRDQAAARPFRDFGFTQDWIGDHLLLPPSDSIEDLLANDVAGILGDLVSDRDVAPIAQEIARKALLRAKSLLAAQES